MSDAPVSDVSGRYATALFELADESGQLDAVAGQLATLSEALKASPDLRRLVESPLYSREETERAMTAVCEALGVGAPTGNLVALMARKRRLFALPDAIRGFERLLAKKRGVVSAEVRSAVKLSKAQRKNLIETLKGATGSEIALDERVDENLIGGLVVKVGSRMIDTSIRSQLNRLQTVMKEAGI